MAKRGKRIYNSSYFDVTINDGKKPTSSLSAQWENFNAYAETKMARYIELIAEIFVERARARLGERYPSATKYASRIFSRRSAGRRTVNVMFDAGEDLPVMYYLEFGTGIRGGEKKHSGRNASFLNISWAYGKPSDNNIYPNGPWFDLTKNKVRETGWNWYWKPLRNKGWVYKDQNGRYKVTSGLVPTEYLYQTYKEIDQIKAEAKERLKHEQTLPRRRIVRR